MAHCWSRVELEADTARQRRYVPVVAAVGSTAPPPNKLLRKLRDYNRAGLGDIPNTGTAAPAAAARAAARRASEEEEEEEEEKEEEEEEEEEEERKEEGALKISLQLFCRSYFVGAIS